MKYFFIRNLINNIRYNIIKAVILAIGYSCCLIAYVYIQDEKGHDNTYKDYNSIYRLTADFYGNNALLDTREAVPYKLDESFKSLSQILGSCQILKAGNPVIRYKKEEYRMPAIYADTNFFKMFNVQFIAGDVHSFYWSVVISESFAKKIFGNVQITDSILAQDGLKHFGPASHPMAGDYHIVGVYKDFPSNSHFKEYNAIFSTDILNYFGLTPIHFLSETYVKVANNTDKKQLEKEINHLLDIHSGRQLKQINCHAIIKLQRLSDIYLKSSNFYIYSYDKTRYGNIFLVDLLKFILIVILILTCANYIVFNLFEYTSRHKQIALLKLNGASKLDIVLQLTKENIVINLISIFLSFICVYFAIKYLGYYLDKNLESGILFSAKQVIAFIFLFLLNILIAFTFQIIFLSIFGKQSSIIDRITDIKAMKTFQNALLALQLGSSTIMLLVGVLLFKQMNFITKADLGQDIHNKIIVESPYSTDEKSWDVLVSKQRPFIQEIKNQTQYVKDAAQLFWYPGLHFGQKVSVKNKNNEGLWISVGYADENYLNVFHIPLVAGRNFNASEIVNKKGVIISEQTCKLLKYKSPKDAIGENFSYLNFESGTYINEIIIGVVKDFHQYSLSKNIEPMAFMPMITYKVSAYYAIELKKGIDQQTAIKVIHEKYKAFFYNNPFDYFYLDDRFYQMSYKSYSEFQVLYYILSIAALLVTLFGVFGMMGYNFKKKSKDYSVKVVLGANFKDLFLDYVKKNALGFFIIVCVGNIIGYLLFKNWLNSFAYRVNITLDTYLYPAILIVILVGAMFTYFLTKILNSKDITLNLKSE